MPRGRDEMQVNVAGLRRNIKNLAHNYSDAQVKVREATSNDPWGPSSTLMAEIADLTYNVMAFTEIMQMIWKRLNDHGKNWRHVYKALVLMEYLIKTGSEKVAMQCKENIYAIHTLKDFQYMEEGKDQGLNVREKAKQLVNLLKDEERLKNERARALKAKQRFAQSANAFGSDGALDTPSSPTYPPVSEHSTGTGSGGSWTGCEAELARPLTAGEEELQLQLALAMSREEAEREERRRRSDDVRLQLALSQSQNDFQLEEYLRQEYYRQQYSCLSTITEHSTNKYEDQEIDGNPEQNNENWQWSGNGWQPFGNNGQWHYNGWQPYGNNWHWSNNGWQPSGNNWHWSHNGWQSFKNNVRWRNRWQSYNKNWPINGWQPFNKNWQYLHNYLPPSNKDCQPSKDWLNNRRHQSGKDWQCSTDGWKLSNTDSQCSSDGWQPSGNKWQTSGNDWRPSTDKQSTEQPEKCWFRGWFQCLHQSVPAPLTTEKKSEPAQSHLLDLLDVNLSPSGPAPTSGPGAGPAPLAGAVPALGAAGLDPWAINTPQHKPETSADSWSVVDSPARDPWAAPPPPDPWAPAAHLHNHLAQNKSPVSVLSSPSSGELGEFDTLSQRRNNNTEPDPFDLTGLGENVPASSASPVQSATGAIKKSPSAFLGENSSLVNLERLLQPAPADLLQPAHNPFADRTTTTPQPAKLTINELKQQQMGGGFPVGGSVVSDPWAPATGPPNNGALNNGAPAAAGWALPTRHTPNPFLS